MILRQTGTRFFRINKIFYDEKFAGMLLLAATILALICANSFFSETYLSIRDTKIGWDYLNLKMSLEHWASDGLLAIFFFIAGLELKYELVRGQLNDVSKAILPVAAAIGGMFVPVLLFVIINRGFAQGWAIPTATDIAFALAVLAVVGKNLPRALRVFLLTLAVVDDLLAIILIAIFFTYNLDLQYLFFSLIPLTIFWFLLKKRKDKFYFLLPLALSVWILVHASGVHATVAGVMLAFVVPTKLNSREKALKYPVATLNEKMEHLWKPISSAIALPIFAFLASGLAIDSFSVFSEALTNRMVIGVIVGLIFGKIIGILGVSFLVTKFTKAKLDPTLSWLDVLGVASLAGMGFTVSLLISELTFKFDPIMHNDAKIGVFLASILAAFIAMLILKKRDNFYYELKK